MRNRKFIWAAVAIVVIVGLLAVWGASSAFTKARTAADHNQNHPGAANTESCPMMGGQMNMEDCSKMHNGGKMPYGMDAKACAETAKSGDMKDCPMHKSTSGHDMHEQMNMQEHSGMSGSGMSHDK